MWQPTTIVKEFKAVFCTTPGKTNDAYHYIHTSGNPVRVPPRRVPAHYQTEVMQQLETMLDQGVITHKKPLDGPCSFCTQKRPASLEYASTTENSTSVLPKICIHYHCQTKCKTGLLSPLYSLHLTCTVDSGNCQKIQQNCFLSWSCYGIV